jgi:hypothetical protein
VGTQQGTIQAVNRTIRAFAEDPRIPAEEQWEFFCECGCFTLVQLTLAAYDAGEGVRAPGHDDRVRPAGTTEPGIPSA